MFLMDNAPTAVSLDVELGNNVGVLGKDRFSVLHYECNACTCGLHLRLMFLGVFSGVQLYSRIL